MNNLRRRIPGFFALGVIATTLSACGGGGGGGIAGPAPVNNSGWQSGVFNDASTYFGRCQVPRAGINPATGNPYGDIQGTTLDENNFLRSYNNDTYLWYSDVCAFPHLLCDLFDEFGFAGDVRAMQQPEAFRVS